MNAPTFLARTEKRKRDDSRCRRAVANMPPEAPWSEQNAPTFTLDRDVARARAEMGESKWQRLNANWPA